MLTLCAIDKGIFTDGQLRLACMEGERLAGCIDLYNYDPINLRAEVGIVVEKSLRHKGYGTAMLQELDCFCAKHYQLHQLYCDIAANNTASIALFARCGYSQCGIMREWVAVGNKFIDTIRMQKIVKQ